MRPFAFTLVLGWFSVAVAVADNPMAASSVAHNQFTFAYRLLQRDHKEAAKAFDDFLGRFPDDEKISDALYYRALIAWLEKDHHSAEWYLHRMVKTVMVPDADVDLLRGQVAASNGKHDEAIECLARIDTRDLEEGVLQMNVWLTRATCYRALGKLPAAASALRSASQIDSDLKARALLDLAVVEQDMGQIDSAIATLEKAVAFKDAVVTPEAAYLAAELQSRQGRHRQAVSYYETVIREYAESGRFAEAVIGLMWSQLSLEQYEGLLKTFKYFGKSLGSPQRLKAMDLAASAHQKLGQHAEAAALMAYAVVEGRGGELEDKLLYKLGRSQYELGQFEALDETGQRLRQSFAKSPYKYHLDLILANAEIKRRRFDRATSRLAAMIDAEAGHPHFAQALLERAWLRESQQEYEAALEDYQRWLDQIHEEGPQRDDVALRLINLYLRCENHEQASKLADQWLDRNRRPNLDPQMEQKLLFARATAQIKLRRYDQAHQTLDGLLSRYPLGAHAAEAAYFDGLVLLGLNRSDDAMLSFTAALKSQKLTSAQRINAVRLSALHWRNQGEPEKSAALLAQVHELSRGRGLQSRERLWLGHHLYEDGRLDEVRELLAPLIGKDPNIVGPIREEAMLMVAACLRTGGDLAGALKAYDQVIAMAGSLDLTAWQEKADVLQQLQQYDRALEEYEGLINRPETRVAARAILESGRTYRALARQLDLADDPKSQQQANEQARRMFLRLTILYARPQISPLPEQAYVERAEVEQDLTLNEASRATFAELQEKFPDGPYAIYARAMLALDSNKRIASKELLRQLRDQHLDSDLSSRVDMQLLGLGDRP